MCMALCCVHASSKDIYLGVDSKKTRITGVEVFIRVGKDCRNLRSWTNKS